MSVQNQTPEKKTVDVKGGLTAGLILVAVGVGMLVFNLVAIEMYFPAVLALIFVTAGIVTRKAGLMIPGGIIGGVGLGVILMESGSLAAQGSQASGGIMLLSMAAGFLSIIPLSKLFSDDTQLWPIFPGAALGIIGGLVLMGSRGLAVLEVLGTYWPAILVVVGLSILIKNLRARSA